MRTCHFATSMLIAAISPVLCPSILRQRLVNLLAPCKLYSLLKSSEFVANQVFVDLGQFSVQRVKRDEVRFNCLPA